MRMGKRGEGEGKRTRVQQISMVEIRDAQPERWSPVPPDISALPWRGYH